MLHILSLGLFHFEEKCSASSLLVCSSQHSESLVIPPHEVLFQRFLRKSGFTGWANIKWKNAKVSVFKLDYSVLIESLG